MCTFLFLRSRLYSAHLCAAVCFHTMRSVSTVRNTFLNSSLSILFWLLHFPVPRFPPLQSGAAFSSPAFSTLAFLLLPRFPVPRFQSPLCHADITHERQWRCIHIPQAQHFGQQRGEYNGQVVGVCYGGAELTSIKRKLQQLLPPAPPTSWRFDYSRTPIIFTVDYQGNNRHPSVCLSAGLLTVIALSVGRRNWNTIAVFTYRHVNVSVGC